MLTSAVLISLVWLTTSLPFSFLFPLLFYTFLSSCTSILFPSSLPFSLSFLLPLSIPSFPSFFSPFLQHAVGIAAAQWCLRFLVLVWLSGILLVVFHRPVGYTTSRLTNRTVVDDKNAAIFSVITNHIEDGSTGNFFMKLCISYTFCVYFICTVFWRKIFAQPNKVK